MPEANGQPPVSPREARFLDNLREARQRWVSAVHVLVRYYEDAGQPERGVRLAGMVADTSDDPEEEAWALLVAGQLSEQAEDFEGAIGWYRRALALEPTDQETWYFTNNNLGYCFNSFGRFDEAEPLCRIAIAVDPGRHNAYKNLGLSLLGMGRFAEAAECLLEATERCPADPRALKRLISLCDEHPEVVEKVDGFIGRFSACLDAQAGR